MFTEPWSDITEYPEGHRAALEKELVTELSKGHVLFGLSSRIIAKREDRDDILIQNKLGYFIVHLTWSGKSENDTFPTSEQFETLEELKIKLASDSETF
ncbi:MAG: polysaccharide lyase [Oleiphilaceae bacterium]|nr:polysaccharide lyase [Oleiphilaceae bacterium]